MSINFGVPLVQSLILTSTTAGGAVYTVPSNIARLTITYALLQNYDASNPVVSTLRLIPNGESENTYFGVLIDKIVGSKESYLIKEIVGITLLAGDSFTHKVDVTSRAALTLIATTIT